MAQGGRPQEYEGAIQYLGTTDRLVKPATLPSSRSASSSSVARRGEPTPARSSSVARRGEPTLAEQADQDEAPSPVRRTSQSQYVR